MKITLGGIAKGYAVDQAIAALRQRGIKRAIVDAGGDLYALGRPPKRNFWEIGIQNPRKKGGLMGTIKVRDEAVVTSGQYERFFILGGKRYGQILNPRTGEPVMEGTLSVTVLAKDTMTADGLATAIFVLGPKKGLDLAEHLKGVEAIIVTKGNKGKMVTLTTEGLKGRLTLNQSLTVREGTK